MSGRTMPFAPEWSSTVHADFSLPVSATLTSHAHFDVNWRSSMYLDGDLDPNVKQPGYAKVNARIGIGPADGRWEVALYARNLTNKATYTYSTDAPLSAGAFVASVEEPRIVGLQFRIKN